MAEASERQVQGGLKIEWLDGGEEPPGQVVVHNAFGVQALDQRQDDARQWRGVTMCTQ